MPYYVKCLASSKRATFVKTRFAESGAHMCGLGDVDAWADLAPITFFALSLNEMFFFSSLLKRPICFFLYYFWKLLCSLQQDVRKVKDSVRPSNWLVTMLIITIGLLITAMHIITMPIIAIVMITILIIATLIIVILIITNNRCN